MFLRIKPLKAFILLWASFTLALLTWWVIFSFRQLEVLQALNPELEVLRHQRMLIYEGLTLYICMFVGAFLLFYFVQKENKALRARKDFLSVFTHDLKTTLTSMRLKLERLSHLAEQGELKAQAEDIQKIGTRLHQQLQNALQLSYGTPKNILIEKVQVDRELLYIQHLWPSLTIQTQGPMVVHTDPFLLRSIMSNLFQNAVDHARATLIEVTQVGSKLNFTILKGEPFQGEFKEFKKSLSYKTSVDSSGLGLKLSQRVMKTLKGKMKFSIFDNGTLQVHLIFPEVAV